MHSAIDFSCLFVLNILGMLLAGKRWLTWDRCGLFHPTAALPSNTVSQLHSISTHETWGVVCNYTVTLDNDDLRPSTSTSLPGGTYVRHCNVVPE